MQQHKRSRSQYESSHSNGNTNDAGRGFPPISGNTLKSNDRGAKSSSGERGGNRGARGGRGRGRGGSRGGGNRGRGRGGNLNFGRPTKFAKSEGERKFQVLPFYIRRKLGSIQVPTEQDYYILSAAKLFIFELYHEQFFGKYYDKSVESYMVCERAVYNQFDNNPKNEDDAREQVLKLVKEKFSHVLGKAALSSVENDNLLAQIRNIKIKVVLGDSLFTKNPPAHAENAILIEEMKEYNATELQTILKQGNPRKFFSSVGEGFASQLIQSEYGIKTEKQGISLIFYDRRKKFADLKDQRLKMKAKICETCTVDENGFYSLEFKSWSVHSKNFWFRFDIAKPKTIEEVKSNFQNQLSHGARLEIFYERDLTPSEMTPEEKTILELSLKELVSKMKYNPITKAFSNIPLTSDFHFCTFRIKDKTSILNDELGIKCTITKVHQYETNNTFVRNEVTFVDKSLQDLKQGTDLLRYFSDPSTVQSGEQDVDTILEERYLEICDKVEKLLRHVLEDCIVQTLK